MKFQDDISNMNTYIHTYIRTSRNQCCLMHSKWPNSFKFDVQAYWVETKEDMSPKLIFHMSTCQDTGVLKIS